MRNPFRRRRREVKVRIEFDEDKVKAAFREGARRGLALEEALRQASKEG